MGLGVLVKVAESGLVYPLLGRPHDPLLGELEDKGAEEAGYDISYPIYLGAQYDASTTNFTYMIPSRNEDTEYLEIVLSFLSPITPTSTFRQAIPASYLTVHMKGGLDADLYVDINGRWVTGHENVITWDLSYASLDGDEKLLKTWNVRRETEQLFTESAPGGNAQAEWGTLHFSAMEDSMTSDMRHEAGESSYLRSRFARNATLQNAIDSEFRAVQDREPVFAFSKTFDFGQGYANLKHRSSHSVQFTIAHTQDPVVQFASARGLTFMRPLWKSYFENVPELLVFHFLDFANVNALASNYSSQLAIDAYESGADDYVDIVALSARQVMGSTSFSGTPENPILFMKEISSNGNFQTIDVIFPAFPFFLYTNPRWLAYLLEPLIEHILSGQYPNDYAMHDLGYSFPNATGHPDGNDEYMPVEECGNILIMGLALANSLVYMPNETAMSIWSTLGNDAPFDAKSNNVFPLSMSSQGGIDYLDNRWGGHTQGLAQAQKWIERSYRLWKQWTGYLIEFSLVPENQLSTDDFAGWLAKQTNLALKGIIGINAMAGLADIIGADADAAFYKNISTTYIAKWEEYGMSRNGEYATLSYDWHGSWTTLYNLFADSLLCFHMPSEKRKTDTLVSSSGKGGQAPLKPSPPTKSNVFVPHHIYKKQSDWYHNVRQRYGLPLDSRNLQTKSDWEFFAVAVASSSVRSEILQSVALWVNETVTDRPLTDLYQTEGDGDYPGARFFARPVVGGHFAFLALGRACGGKAMDGLSFLDEE
ncbi:MAG: hypothetical protein Q9160_004737 [Pyrenula sp. 1 TL-2023]